MNNYTETQKDAIAGLKAWLASPERTRDDLEAFVDMVMERMLNRGEWWFRAVEGLSAALPARGTTAPKTHERPQTGSWVYAIGPTGGGLSKIGLTHDVPRRLAALQCGSPVPLVVLWTTPGGSDIEGRLHKALAAKRTHGEWFDLGPDPVRAIMEALG